MPLHRQSTSPMMKRAHPSWTSRLNDAANGNHTKRSSSSSLSSGSAKSKSSASSTSSSWSSTYSSSSATNNKNNGYISKFNLPPINPISIPLINPSSTMIPLSLPTAQSRFMEGVMKDVRGRVSRDAVDRNGSDGRAGKRIKLHHDESESLLNDASSKAVVSASKLKTATHSSTTNTTSAASSSTTNYLSARTSILQEMEHYSKIAQIVASPGGMISIWNKAFTNITHPTFASSSDSSSPASIHRQQLPLTIFELLDPTSLKHMYRMLALALHEDVVVADVDTSSSPSDEKSDDGSGKKTSHLAITLLCKKFRGSDTRYNITIIFMDDDSPMKRCFFGVLTPSSPSGHHGNKDEATVNCIAPSVLSDDSDNASPAPSLPTGKILRVGDDLLCQLLQSSGK
ncbi:predicted protein [Thalassiosira pseudonana CCMP1335]|uniref:Uncharacterized protein n=1 Tax=Thalassiosira pseudonana TaxID=35128 RepID=B5YM95_THAPS|nr:predicted protein [Thalassiosira pseudonana CCMP1335]ACI64373.1 predicted protein [Thalassiosira pseudonana CCMP1335]